MAWGVDGLDPSSCHTDRGEPERPAWGPRLPLCSNEVLCRKGAGTPLFLLEDLSPSLALKSPQTGHSGFHPGDGTQVPLDLTSSPQHGGLLGQSHRPEP